jgi:branched-subunit amino acid transport protein
MTTDLVPLAILMGLATYPMRALPLLAAGLHGLPRAADRYLRLVAPSVLASLAADSIMIVVDPAGDSTFHIGSEWLSVGVCVFVVAWRRSLFLGLVLGAGLMIVLRALGFAP